MNTHTFFNIYLIFRGPPIYNHMVTVMKFEFSHNRVFTVLPILIGLEISYNINITFYPHQLRYHF